MRRWHVGTHQPGGGGSPDDHGRVLGCPFFARVAEGQAEVDRYWNGLLQGGGKEVACGWLTDRYGVRWQIVPRVLEELMAGADKAKAKRVAEAMMNMVKLDAAALERA